MGNNYNSLTEKLILNGIIRPDNPIELAEESTIYAENPINKIVENSKITKNKKRLNNSDINFIKESSKKDIDYRLVASIEAIGKILKLNLFDEYNKKFINKLFYKFFPSLYKAKRAKKIMEKLIELNIDTKTLFNKTIPYGEADVHYKDLIKYLNYTNEIKLYLNKKAK